MGEFAANIPVNVEINEESKSVMILIPWDRLAKLKGEEFREWLAKASKIKAEWEAKGYRCN